MSRHALPSNLVQTRETASPSHVILYLHGGAGYAGSPSSHRKLAGHLAGAAGSYALVLDYRLTPENVFPAAVEDAVSACRWLLGRGVSSTHIATAGDSAGGNFAVTSVLKLKELGIELPAATVLFSAWIDMEFTGATMKTNAEMDVVVSAKGSATGAAMCLGQRFQPA
jgi:monoterpene epsilon-lactone hydrolase